MRSQWGENGGSSRRDDSTPLPWRLRDLVVSLALVLGMVALYAFTGALDDKADRELQQLAEAERARIATRARLPAKVQEAYDQELAVDERRCFQGRDGRQYCYRAGDPR